MNIYEKLLKVQEELKAPKNQLNKFGGYKYRSLEDIQEAVKPLLSKVKAILIIKDEIVEIAGRFYVKAIAEFIDVENGEKIMNTAFAREAENKKGMDEAQITGASSSYARKYALNGLFAIDDTKDADATNTHGKTETKKKEVKKIQKKEETQKSTEQTKKYITRFKKDFKIFEEELGKEEAMKTLGKLGIDIKRIRAGSNEEIVKAIKIMEKELKTIGLL